MRSRILSLALLLGAVLGSCSDGGKVVSPDPNDEPWNYPDTLLPLDDAVLAERLARFHAQNPGVCAAIDPFGRLTEDRSCPSPDEEGVADSAAAVAVARSFLERNREFFHLAGELPSVYRVRAFTDHRWEVEFARQVVDGLVVYHTGIYVTLARSVYQVAGGHYPEFRVPRNLNLQPSEARALLPAQITFLCWSPIEVFLGEEPTLVAFPLWIEPPGSPPRLELRTAYRFSYESAGGQAVLDILVDAMTGERIATHYRIIC